MPKYQYTALDHKGDQKTGTLEANSEAEAMESLSLIHISEPTRPY